MVSEVVLAGILVVLALGSGASSKYSALRIENAWAPACRVPVNVARCGVRVYFAGLSVFRREGRNLHCVAPKQ